MKRGEDFLREESERKQRRKVFHFAFSAFAFVLTGLLVWNLKSLILPITVGALLAFLFRPVKERFKVRWVPHELQVLCSFAAIGLLIFLTINNVRKHIPNEKQKLELRVRTKYKLNEKFQQLVKPHGASSGMLTGLIAKEAGPVMDQLNHWLDLNQEERDLFMKYRAGFNGEDPIEDRFFDYFQANQTTDVYTKEPEAVPGEKAVAPAVQAKTQASVSSKSAGSKLHDELTIWMLAPLVFIFLGFDNGQLRRYFISLVPNRYFELSLTVLDMLDDAIGKYLRGTLMECALVGLTLTIGFILLGIPVGVAIAIGVVSGLVNAIPFLGTVIGLIIGLGYALIAENTVPLIPWLQADDLVIYVVVLVAIAHLLDNVVYQPFVLGSAVNVHPLVVILAIISGSLLMGLWGMLFAIPTVVVLKTAVETLFKELKAYRII
jgi:predicted PurR-regulated permease PerM